MFPSALHLLQGISVKIITTGDEFVQMFILRLDDLIGGISMELDITWSTQLFTRHCLQALVSSHGYPAVKSDDVERMGHLGLRAPQRTHQVTFAASPSLTGYRDRHVTA